MARGGRAVVAVRQDLSGRRDVERQSQDGRDQEDGRKGREVQRLLDPEGDHQDQNGERDGKGEADVDDGCRQRHEQHRDDEHDADGEADVLRARLAVLDRFHDLRCSCHSIPCPRRTGPGPGAQPRRRSLREDAQTRRAAPAAAGRLQFRRYGAEAAARIPPRCARRRSRRNCRWPRP